MGITKDDKQMTKQQQIASTLYNKDTGIMTQNSHIQTIESVLNKQTTQHTCICDKCAFEMICDPTQCTDKDV